jgi:DNA ligase 1
MLFKQFSQYLEKLENTPSRLEMMYQLSDLFNLLDETEISEASYLMQGNLVPRYLSLEFQLSIKMIVRALARLEFEGIDGGGESGSDSNSVSENSLFEEVDSSFKDLRMDSLIKETTKRYKKSGDVGDITKEIVTKFHQKSSLKKELSILDVYEELKNIAVDGGEGSQDRKVVKLAELLKNLDEVSSKFVVRIIMGKLRLGFSAMTMLDALSWSVLDSKNHRNLLENAYQKKADVGELAKLYLSLARSLKNELENKMGGDTKIFPESLATQLDEKYLVEVGTPVVPALCQRLNSSEEIIEKMTEVIAEPKYDGLRIQIHYSKNGFGKDVVVTDAKRIKAFTRNLEDVTHMFPELETVADNLNCDSCILDAEAIGYNSKTGELLPFQETITRKRKHAVEEQSEKVPIRFYFFDCMFLNKKSLLDEKLRSRKDLLRGLFSDSETIVYTSSITTTDPKVLRDFHSKQLGGGLEGAVMKQPDSSYKSGRKGWRWVKIKEEEGMSGKLKDTLDLVVMGYYFGKGKRSKFGVGAFLVGVMDDQQKLKTIAKIGTGLTDEEFIELKNRADLLEVKVKPEDYQVPKSLFPDIWMRPELVVEIAADEITKSPTHTAGVALRFPRLVKFRDDKNWTDATTIKELTNF